MRTGRGLIPLALSRLPGPPLPKAKTHARATPDPQTGWRVAGSKRTRGRVGTPCPGTTRGLDPGLRRGRDVRDGRDSDCMNETCDRCGPAVRAVYRAERAGELYLCRHCGNRLWPALYARGWTMWPVSEHALARLAT